MRKVLKNFEIFYQLDGLVWKLNHPGSLGSVFQNSSLGTLLCLCRFLVIRSRNCTPFVLLDF